MINTAIVGTGGYAYEILKRIWSLPHLYDLTAAVSLPGQSNPGLDECRTRGVAVYSSLDDMLAAVSGRVDMVFAPTSIHTHYEVAAKCLDFGCNVFIEKPPVVTVQDYDDLLRRMERNGKTVAVGFQFMYSRIVQQIKNDLCAMKYGRIKRVRSLGCWTRYDWYYKQVPWLGKLRIDGKWVLDGSINNPLAHMLANSLYFASAKPGMMADAVTVEAQLYSGHDIEGEDTASLRIITDDGIEIISNTTLCPLEDTEIETVIECEYADVVHTDFNRCLVRWKDGRVENFTDTDEQRTYMLESVAASLAGQSLYKADLRVCRPFTLTVNCAYESSGQVHHIDDLYITTSNEQKGVKTVIDGIDEAIKYAHKTGTLLGDSGLDWTVKTIPYKTAGYSFFPQAQSLKTVGISEPLVLSCS